MCVLWAVIEYYYIDNNNHYLNVMQYTVVNIPTAIKTILKKYNLMHTSSQCMVLSAQSFPGTVHDCMKFYYICRNECFAHPQIQVLRVSMKTAN